MVLKNLFSKRSSVSSLLTFRDDSSVVFMSSQLFHSLTVCLKSSNRTKFWKDGINCLRIFWSWTITIMIRSSYACPRKRKKKEPSISMCACVTAISFLSLHYLVLCYSHFEYLICCICIGMMSLRCLCYVFANGNYSVRLCNVWCIEVKKNLWDPTREPKTGTNLPVNTILVGKRCLHTSFEFFLYSSSNVYEKTHTEYAEE